MVLFVVVLDTGGFSVFCQLPFVLSCLKVRRHPPEFILCTQKMFKIIYWVATRPSVQRMRYVFGFLPFFFQHFIQGKKTVPVVQPV